MFNQVRSASQFTGRMPAQPASHLATDICIWLYKMWSKEGLLFFFSPRPISSISSAKVPRRQTGQEGEKEENSDHLLACMLYFVSNFPKGYDEKFV